MKIDPQNLLRWYFQDLSNQWHWIIQIMCNTLSFAWFLSLSSSLPWTAGLSGSSRSELLWWTMSCAGKLPVCRVPLQTWSDPQFVSFDCRQYNFRHIKNLLTQRFIASQTLSIQGVCVCVHLWLMPSPSVTVLLPLFVTQPNFLSLIFRLQLKRGVT